MSANKKISSTKFIYKNFVSVLTTILKTKKKKTSLYITHSHKCCRLNLKVILLIRDPRGVLQSRQHRNFCQPSPDCWKPELLCADMISDYVAAGRLIQQFPDKIL